MIETWVNNKGFKLTMTFHKTNLTFREAAYETMKDIRARTNKTLIIPLSGGADSTIVYHVAKDLGIEFKTVHQRYWDGDKLINEYENKHVDPDTVDVYQDINCSLQGEFRTSQWFKEVFEDYWPSPWWVGLQPWIKEILDPNNDFIINAGGTGVKEWNYQNNSIGFYNAGLMMNVGPCILTREGFEGAGFVSDNPIILYTLFDRNIMKNMSDDHERCQAERYRWSRRLCHDEDTQWERPYKNALYKHHFPEFDHLLKIPQKDWPWPLVGSEPSGPCDWWSLRSEYGNIRGYVPDNTEFNPIKKLDLFFDCIDNNVPISDNWNEWNWNLSDYGKEKLQYKIFTDKIEHFPASTPRSRLW